jgi:predicted RNA-binding protein YlxR (DUF448 family)
LTEKGPIRTCIGCGERFPKDTLLRFVVDNEGNLIPDIKKKLPGRGASLCYANDCVKSALKKRQFTRHLKTNLNEITIDELRIKTLDALYNYLYTIMRFAFGGSNIVDGLDLCVKEIKDNNIKLCLITEDISQNSLKKILPVVNRYNVKVTYISDKKNTAIKLHHPIRTVFGIKDEVLADKLLDILNKIEKVKTWIG